MNYLLFFIFFLMTPAFADHEGGAGDLAVNLLQPVSLFSDFVNTSCIIIGVSFIFASFIKYFEYRRSPLMTPFSTVFFLFLMGVFLLLLPFAYKLTDNGIPYSL